MAPNRNSIGERMLRATFASLYGCCDWAYDSVAWCISGGLWKKWTFAAEGFVCEQPVVEVGVGRGHLLAHMAQQGWQVIGIDNSLQMVKAAQHRLKNGRLPGAVICADGRSLPLPDGAAGTIVSAFPSPYVLERQTWVEFARVLRPSGRWIIVDDPMPDRFHPRLVGMYVTTFLRRILRGQKGSADEINVAPDLFPIQRQELVPVGPTRVRVWILCRGE